MASKSQQSTWFWSPLISIPSKNFDLLGLDFLEIGEQK